ncbi:hypothetical protein, partial [Yersinia enterocolitica]|uniref:hypothetical protein n=1 Tax=Yersinia enterocolitica TaxID=630 RepID=UPI000A8D0656
QKGHQIGSLKICYVMPALAGVGFNRFTTFGWMLFHNDWINQSSTHANVEMQKGRLSDLDSDIRTATFEAITKPSLACR